MRHGSSINDYVDTQMSHFRAFIGMNLELDVPGHNITTKQVAQGQYVVSDTHRPALSDCELD